jgi:YHS domain-containing protein
MDGRMGRWWDVAVDGDWRNSVGCSSSATEKGITTMIESKSATKDSVCGMAVDESSALHAERDGKTFYFCSDHCRQAFVSTPGGAHSKDKAEGCC